MTMTFLREGRSCGEAVKALGAKSAENPRANERRRFRLSRQRWRCRRLKCVDCLPLVLVKNSRMRFHSKLRISGRD
jgi:hypothetical protein